MRKKAALMALCLITCSTLSFAEPDDQAGVITFASGNTQIFTKEAPANGSQQIQYESERYYSSAAKPGTAIHEGAIVHTGTDGQARLVYSNGDQVNFGPGSSVRITKREIKDLRRRMVLDVLHGRIRATVKPTVNPPVKSSSGDFEFKVKTRSMVSGVRGTDFTMEYNPGSDTSSVSVLRGVVAVQTNATQAIKEVSSGNSAAIKADSALDIRPTTRESLAEIQQFSYIKPERALQALKEIPDKKVAAQVERAEVAAAATVRADIKVHDPKLFARLSDEGTSASATTLNAAVLAEQMQTAPAEKPTEKHLKNEMHELGDDVYKKYFKAE